MGVDILPNADVTKSLGSVQLLPVVILGQMVTCQLEVNYKATAVPEVLTLLLVFVSAISCTTFWRIQFGDTMKLLFQTWTIAFIFALTGHVKDLPKMQAYVQQLQPEEQITHVFLFSLAIFLCIIHNTIGEDWKYFCIAVITIAVDIYEIYETVAIYPMVHMVQSVAIALIWLFKCEQYALHTKIFLTISIVAGIGATGSNVYSLLQPGNITWDKFACITLNGMTTWFALFLRK